MMLIFLYKMIILISKVLFSLKALYFNRLKNIKQQKHSQSDSTHFFNIKILLYIFAQKIKTPNQPRHIQHIQKITIFIININTSTVQKVEKQEILQFQYFLRVFDYFL